MYRKLIKLKRDSFATKYINEVVSMGAQGFRPFIQFLFAGYVMLAV